MSRALLLSVRFHDGRYHGEPEWPPSPARLFQALVAAAAGGGQLSEDNRVALVWLESLPPPTVAAPAASPGRGFINYVPNNDLDSVGGDPDRISEIRTAKLIRPRLFDAAMTLLYAWQFDEGEEQASKVCAIAERLFQLGRGVDMAWAWAEIVDADEIDRRFAAHGGAVHRPVEGDGATHFCPQKGSLESLVERFERMGKRFSMTGKGRRTQQLFSQAPKPLFRSVTYDSPPQRFLFDLRRINEGMDLDLWPLTRASSFVERLRDGAAERLQKALPSDKAIYIERALIGRGAREADKASRIRILPIPSIGSPHVMLSMRRVLVEVPGNCPLPADAVRQSFSGLQVAEHIDPQSGEVIEVRLVAAEGQEMLRHYGISQEHAAGRRRWRTVTPVALPERAARRRIDPKKLHAEQALARRSRDAAFKETKGSRERLDEDARAVGYVLQALRHAGISTPVDAIRVQREPFEGRGARAEAFAEGTRFAKERLWHLEIAFAKEVRGPLIIGDGRYLGLGLLAPASDAWRDVLTFRVPRESAIPTGDGPALVHAARRALMSLSRNRDGRVPRLFSGHEPDGGRAASGGHEHVFLVADDHDKDGLIDRLIVAAPWACDRLTEPERGARGTFEVVVSRLEILRAGRLGVIALCRPLPPASDDPLIGPSRVWESRTPYRPTRHASRGKNPAVALVRDLADECVRRGFPRPEIEVLEFSAGPNGGGVAARARLSFAAAIRGPLLLGRDSHRGGGLFSCA